MSILTSLGIVIMAMLIQGFLQLTPGIFTIFCHYNKTKNSPYFMLGAATAITIILVTTFIVVFDTSLLRYIMAGILIAFSILSFFFYFKKGQSTELFISRKVAKTLSLRAKHIKNRSDAFVLGAMSEGAELIFILPATIAVSIAVSSSADSFFRISMMALFVIAALIPLSIINFMYKNGKNLADIQKTRVRNKTFCRIILSVSYIVIAILIISAGAIQ